MLTKRNILFVDDEDKILDGLRRLLRPMRHEWRVALAQNGQDALEKLTMANFDVIVSDMRMPGMDGAELLTRVKESYPSIVRIVLSGHTEISQALRSVGVAHQFLSKPCSPVELTRVVARALELRAHLTAAPIQAAVGDIDGLPPLPETFARLREALVLEEVDLEQVANIVEADPSLTVKLLQLVNSSLFGLARPVANMRDATTFLGTTLLRNLTLTTETFRVFDKLQYPKGFSLHAQQAHGALAARIARELAVGRELKDEAFLAAMLHDVGLLVIATKMPAAFELIARDPRLPGESREEVELRLLGTSHSQIGAYLLGIWGLPDSIVEAVACHHKPSTVAHEDFGLIEIVHVAGALADELEMANGSDHEASVLDLEHLERLGVLDRLEEWRALARRIDDPTYEAA